MRTARLAFAAIVSFNFIVSSGALGQAPSEKVDLDVVAKIKEEGLKRSQAMETISYLTDVHGPRLTGSPQIRAAAEWTKTKLSEWGLQNSHLEPWGPFGRGWSLEGFTANMVQPGFSPLIAFPKAWSPSTPKAVRGTPIYLDAANEKDLDQYRGKLHRAIVLLSPPRDVKAIFDPPARRQTEALLLALSNGDLAALRSARGLPPGTVPSGSATPSSSSASSASGPTGTVGGTPEERSSRNMLSKKWELIYDEQAAVVLEPGRGDGGTVFVSAATLPNRSGSPASTSESQPLAAGENRPNPQVDNPYSRGPRPWAKDAAPIVPQVVMAVEHYNRIMRMLKKGTPVEVEIDITSRYHADDLMSHNVIAEIPGGDLKDEVVMLGGHFDSWHSGTGATDNAVGCGVALEAVRILQAIGVKPRRTIRLALWTGEEQGLLGSRAYVAEHFGRAITPTSSGSGRGRSSRSGSTSGEPSKDENRAQQPDAAAAAGSQKGSADSQSPTRRPPTKYELKPDHAKFAAYFNLDNGTGKVRGVYLQGNEAVRPIFRAWLAPFADMGALTLAPSNTGGTDHLSFDGVGLPGFQFIQDPLEYDSRTHHSSMDVFDRLQEDDVKQASIIMASFVYHAAMRDEKLPRKPLVGEIVTAPEKAPQQ